MVITIKEGGLTQLIRCWLETVIGNLTRLQVNAPRILVAEQHLINILTRVEFALTDSPRITEVAAHFL